MQLNKVQDGTELTVVVEGRLDTATAPQLEEVVVNLPDEIEHIILDLDKLTYLSSAGLRVILSAQKKMGKKGSMKILNVNETIMEIFEITGFVDILTIE